MAYRYNYRAIRARFPIERVMAMIKILHMQKKGREWVGPCPACGGKDSLALDHVKNNFTCDLSGQEGSVIDLVSHLNDECTLDEACALIEKYEKKASNEREETPEPETEKVLEGEILPPLKALVKDHEHVLDMGFPVEVASHIGIGFQKATGLMRQCVAIPLRDEKGVLAGYVGITPGTEVKLPTKWFGIPNTNVVPLKKRRA